MWIPQERQEFARERDLLPRSSGQPRATSIQICLSSLITKHTRDNPLIYDDLRRGLDGLTSMQVVTLISFEYRNLAGLCLSWEVDTRGCFRMEERKGLKESFERRIGKNIGIRRVCRFWLLYIVIRIMHDLLSLLKDIVSESRWKGTGNFFDFPNYNFDSLILISNFSCCRGNETWWKV